MNGECFQSWDGNIPQQFAYELASSLLRAAGLEQVVAQAYHLLLQRRELLGRKTGGFHDTAPHGESFHAQGPPCLSQGNAHVSLVLVVAFALHVAHRLQPLEDRRYRAGLEEQLVTEL